MKDLGIPIIEGYGEQYLELLEALKRSGLAVPIVLHNV